MHHHNTRGPREPAAPVAESQATPHHGVRSRERRETHHVVLERRALKLAEDQWQGGQERRALERVSDREDREAERADRLAARQSTDTKDTAMLQLIASMAAKFK